MHTQWSDGSGSIEDMARAAAARGYEYIAITDHSKGLKIAGGIDERALRKQAAEIDAANETSTCQVLKSIEMNLNPAGEVHDLERIKFLHQHLEACARAVRDGVNLAGYYVWSLLDNFEWAYGYQKRFGIVYVDFPSGRRTPKASAAFYSRVARENAVPPLPAAWPL